MKGTIRFTAGWLITVVSILNINSGTSEVNMVLLGISLTVGLCFLVSGFIASETAFNNLNSK
jgi:hypothetical protein